MKEGGVKGSGGLEGDCAAALRRQQAPALGMGWMDNGTGSWEEMSFLLEARREKMVCTLPVNCFSKNKGKGKGERERAREREKQGAKDRRTKGGRN